MKVYFYIFFDSIFLCLFIIQTIGFDFYKYLISWPFGLFNLKKSILHKIKSFFFTFIF